MDDETRTLEPAVYYLMGGFTHCEIVCGCSCGEGVSTTDLSCPPASVSSDSLMANFSDMTCCDAAANAAVASVANPKSEKDISGGKGNVLHFRISFYVFPPNRHRKRFIQIKCDMLQANPFPST